MTRGFAGDTVLDDARYEPIYRLADELDLPIRVHAGNGSPSFARISFGRHPRPDVVGGSGVSALAAACWLVSGLPEKYPSLRIALLETASVWLPFALNRCQRFAARQLGRTLPGSAMRDARIYVAVEEYEPLAATLRCPDLDAVGARKIVSDNAVRFYGL